MLYQYQYYYNKTIILQHCNKTLQYGLTPFNTLMHTYIHQCTHPADPLLYAALYAALPCLSDLLPPAAHQTSDMLPGTVQSPPLHEHKQFPTRASAPVAHLPVACPAACQNEPLRLRLRINGPRKAGAAGLADGLAIHLPQVR